MKFLRFLPVTALALLLTLNLHGHDEIKKIPIVYCPEYNISLLGSTFIARLTSPVIEKVINKIHPFDGKKYGKIVSYFSKKNIFSPEQCYASNKASHEDLLLVHSRGYLESLSSPAVIAKAFDLGPFIAQLPNPLARATKSLLQNIIEPMRYATGGTVLTAQLAMQYGWAINLSGGYHHAKPNKAEGGCFFADIPLAIKKLRLSLNKPDLNVLIVDLDAHRGNGLAMYVQNDPHTFLFDMYNNNVYPGNIDNTEQYITFNNPLDGGNFYHRKLSDQEYMFTLTTQLPEALELLEKNKTKPDLIIFNAGTDPYKNDPLGCMNISKNGILKRDEYVCSLAMKHAIPIALTLSGGYAHDNVDVICSSFENLLLHVFHIETVDVKRANKAPHFFKKFLHKKAL